MDTDDRDDDPGHVDRARQKSWKAIHYVDRESFEKDFEKIMPMSDTGQAIKMQQ